MGDDSGYSSHLSAEAVAFLLSLTKRQQRKVLDIAERIAEAPFGLGDYQSTDSDGRIIENILVDEFHFSYWLDHTACEVRITEIIKV